MADLTLSTSAHRLIGGNVVPGVGGAAINVGMAVYMDANNKWQKAIATAAITAGSIGKIGIALTECQADGAPIYVQTDGDFTNSGLTAGIVYLVSAATAGLFAPIADVDTANGYATYMFIARSATVGKILALPMGVTI